MDLSAFRLEAEINSAPSAMLAHPADSQNGGFTILGNSGLLRETLYNDRFFWNQSETHHT
jgi:hypothetical protein